MKIIKRNGSEATFDSEKIVAAITKANNSEEGTRLSPEQIHDIADYVEYKCNKIGRAVSVEEVQDMVENQIMATGAFDLAKHYVQYRYQRSLIRKSNTTDTRILSLIECNNEEAKHIQLPSNPINKYRCMDSIIWNNLIPDAGNEREGGNQMQLNATFGISAIWTEYMCYHYEMLLDSILKEKKIQLQLHVERERYDSLLKTQVSFFDSIGYSGSAAPMAYSDLEEKVHAVWLAGVLDLYFSLQTEDYRPDNIYKPIPDNIIAREYDTILYNIDNHRIYEYLSIANSRNNIKLCLLNVKAAWKNLMDIRKETSRRLRGKTKDIYNNATYRLQRFHLLQLKNSFEGYGVISNEDYSCLLSDTCSHEELLRASNISVRRDLLLQKLEDEYNNQ